MIRPRGVGGRNGGDAPCPHPQPLQLHLFASSGLPGCLSVCLFGEQRFSPPHVTGSRATHTHTHNKRILPHVEGSKRAPSAPHADHSPPDSRSGCERAETSSPLFSERRVYRRRLPGDGSLHGASRLLKRETFQREQRVSASKVLLSENAMKAPFHPLCYTNPQVLRLGLEGVVGGLHLPKSISVAKNLGQ